MEDTFYISTDSSLMDVPMIQDYLANDSYWAKGRSMESVEKSMKHSLCFGAFDKDHQQVGFARVATDYVVFAWVMDVFVKKEYQGKGIGEKLLRAIVDHGDLKSVNGIGLRTHDAQKFYQRFGFETISEPNTWMFKSKR